MKGAIRSASSWMFLASVAVLACWLSAFPAVAQRGQDAVYNSSNGVTNSPAFIDASMFGAQNTDICAVLNFIMSPGHGYPLAGAVIDARGLPGTTGTGMTCTASPWAGITNPPPSTILLPAGTIVIPTTWVLPSNTRLVGEGDGIPSTTSSTFFSPGTMIQVASGSLLSTMIQFGSSSVCPGSVPTCTGISVENLTLNGLAQSVDGIVNQYAQSNSYVDHVSIYQILGTGLLISDSGSSSASNSGPYTNITFDTGGYSGAPSTACAQIIGTSGTRGIHGLKCKSETQDANAAVLVDASNNSIEDVTIVGFYDGILVGANAAAQSNVLVNIIGDTAAGSTPVNAVHISNHNTVTDLSIMGASNSGLSGTYTIQDDVTGPHLLDQTIGIYALGESAGSGVHSRFSTSPNVAHWTVGTAAPLNTPACTRGSLYSCTGPTGVNCSSSAGNAALCRAGPPLRSL